LRVILIKYGELSTKKGNRNFFINTLYNNVKEKLSKYSVKIFKDRARMYIEFLDEDLEQIKKIIDKIFTYNDFETESIICKVGGISKDTVNLSDTKPMCNPITQAKFLNKAKTDFNVVVGLCVGHDSLFIKYSEAPVTVLAVKDRVLAHNPLGAVYLADGFYRNKLFPPKNQF